MDDSKFQTTLLKRLNTLISLMLDVALSGKSTSIAEKVLRLLDIGITPAEVGEILGKPTNYVTAVMHSKKKKMKKRS